MKNSQKGFVVPLLLGIIAVLVIGGGVYIYNNKKLEAPVVPIDTNIKTTNQVQQTNTQTPLVNTQTNTLNWKTYTNTKYSFSFQYPASYGNLVTLDDNVVALGQKNINEDGFSANLSINMPRVLLNSVGQPETLSDLVNYFNTKGNTETNVTIGDIQSLEISSSQIGTEVFVPFSGNKMLEIIGDARDLMFNQILSTFKFTK